MGDEDQMGCAVISITVIIACILFLVCTWRTMNYNGGYEDATQKLRAEAVEHGAAEYIIVDQKNGKSEFKWKTKEE